VHNGIDLRPYKTVDRLGARRQLGFQDSELLIGAIGRLAPQKGFVHLIRAMPQVLAAVPNARLVLAGDGPLERELKDEAVECGVAERVQFLGFRRDILELLTAFDIFALPSLWEGLSISLIEALAAGKPIVATDIDGNREVIDNLETGLLVPPADAGAFAAALLRLLTDRSLAERLAVNARLSAESRFSMERMVEQNLAVYNRVAAGERAGKQRASGPSYVKSEL
jgi:glycosyltransferase involved in cell wall biosynthesis